MDDSNYKRRRIVVNDDDDDEDGNERKESVADNDNNSNPDDYEENLDGDEEDDEGEDLNENWIDDYAPAPELDFYDSNLLAKDDDDELYETYDKRIRDRLSAEEELDALDAKRRERDLQTEHNLERVNRFEQEELDDDDDEDEERDDDEELLEDAEKALNLEAFECPLKEWISEERTRREISRRFKKFLLSYYPGIDEVTNWVKTHDHMDPLPPLPSHLKVSPPIYPVKIRSMCAINSASLEISYAHLADMQSLLAIWLTDVPRDMLQIFDEVLQTVVLADFPHYNKIVQETHVRIIHLPIADRLRNLRQSDLNSLIRVSGVITKRSKVNPQMKTIAYDCLSCGVVLGPYRIVNIEIRPEICVSCGNRGPFRPNQLKTEYGNHQLIELQETPGSVPPGRVPRHKSVVLLGDLTDIARPGEEIEVTGIYMHSNTIIPKRSNGFPVFSTIIEANCIQKRHGSSSTLLSEDDKRRIRDLSNDPQIGERIFRSIAPSIFGHRHVKAGIALALFGGCHKESGSSGMHRVRGDINVLLLGDPGTAKSQILKYAEKTAPRAVFTAGKGASAVGLTAGVHKDPITKEWTLEGGALVLADQGVCLIDEFDKMNEQDRTSIHEAMEQQTISVSKAGIVTSLQARCAVIAAANPIGGRYDPSYSFAENVELTDPILQRFDVLCVLQDTVDPVIDEQLATFVVNSHHRSHPDHAKYEAQLQEQQQQLGHDGTSNAGGTNNNGNDSRRQSSSEQKRLDEDDRMDVGNNSDKSPFDDLSQMMVDDGPEPLSQDLLKKYIMYARAYVKPILHDIDTEKIASLYAELRAASAVTGGVPIAVRHIESIMRMSEASARMHLRDHVREDDVDLAIKVMLESFLQAQKVSVRRSLQKSFRKYLTYGEASNQLLMHKLLGLVVEVEKYKKLTNNISKVTEVFIVDLENTAKELNIFDLTGFFNCNLFKSLKFQVDKSRGLIIKTYV